jgi:hypothetical protein
MLAAAGPAAAQTYTVTNLGDSGAEGDGSLRGEVRAANAHEGPDTIDFAPGLSGTITFGGNGIVVDDPLDIEGPGPGQVTIEQTVAHRVFEVEPAVGAAVKIAGLHLADGIAPGGGAHPGRGGDLINAGANLTLENDLITGGEAEYGGGVLSFEGPLALRSSTVADNSAEREGGVSAAGFDAPWSIVDSTIADNEAAEFTGGLGGEGFGTGEGLIEGSTISGNTAGEGTGGALLSSAFGGFITVRNSTITGNTAGGETGGLLTFPVPFGGIAIEDSTIAGNTAGSGAGGIKFEGDPGALALTDTIVADNTSGSGADLMTDAAPETAFSLIGDVSGPTFTESVPGSDVLGVSARLESLRDNGGPTETMAPLPTSPAVNKGGGALTTDQRGDPRPVIYPGVSLSIANGANGADIGAYELSSPPATGGPPPPPPPVAPAPAAKGPPRVRVSCPKRAKPGGCKFALQIVSAPPRKAKGQGKRGAKPPVAESAVAKVKLGAGKSALVTLTPKPKFAAKLDSAAKLLVRETVTAKGETATAFRRLKVVGR